MNIVTDRQYMIFRKDNEFGTFYKVGLSKKDMNGNYINGYKDVRFKKGVNLENKTIIYISIGGIKHMKFKVYYGPMPNLKASDKNIFSKPSSKCYMPSSPKFLNSFGKKWPFKVFSHCNSKYLSYASYNINAPWKFSIYLYCIKYYCHNNYYSTIIWIISKYLINIYCCSICNNKFFK